MATLTNGINANPTTPLPIANGGTGENTASPTATGGNYAAWDSNKNLSANNLIEGYATTVTAAGTTTLTVASAFQQYFTGTTTQTVVMPVASTLVLGQSWLIVNSSTGNVTVNSSGGNAIVTLAPSSQTIITCILTSGTTAASWSSDYGFNSGGIESINGTTNQVNVTIANNIATLSTPQNINTGATPQFANVIEGYSTTATASGTTTLTNTSNNQQFFTGTLSQIVQMPVASTCTLGQTWRIVNNSTAAITVNSSGGNLIGNVAANTIQLVTCILTSGTTAASWYFSPFNVSFVNIQTFTSSGTYTPTPGMVYCIVEMVGGGGGGGGTPTATSSTSAVGSSGGSAAYSKGIYSASTIGASQTVTIGSAGSSSANGNGTAGGQTSLGSLLTAPGGAGGPVGSLRSSTTVVAGGAGGVAGTGGTINATGSPGQSGMVIIGTNALSGNGASTLFGGGAPGVTGTNANGQSATANSGSGGSGSMIFGVTGVAAIGGAGGTGLVTITEYVG